MSALPVPAGGDGEPLSGVRPQPSVGDGATVVPLLAPVPFPLRLVDGIVARTAEPIVDRRRLFERLAAAAPVTVIAAPAASGKTCLLRSWIADAGLGPHAGWATVRPGERDERRFWRSVNDELARAGGGERPGVLVIDDLHELKSPEAQAQLQRWLTRMPSQLRVVLLTRTALGFSLHRLRLAGALTELRAADLRLTVPETCEVLEVAGVALSDAGVAALHERSEGWAGGVRLAAAQLADHPDPERFVREFSGTERTVAEYLRAEVLDRQPPEVRDLLVRTSVLERVSGPLADALAGCSGSVGTLQDLDESGAFVSAIDVGRTWFRYHPLLVDLLRLELRRANPALVGTLHRVAGEWHEQHGDIVEAIRHAQAAGDWSRAAHLLADHQLALYLDGRMAAIRTVLDGFPTHAPASDAELALASARAPAVDGFDDESAAHVVVAEQIASTLADGRRPAFEVRLAGTRLWLARLRGDAARASDAFRCAEAALSALPAGDRMGSSLDRATALLNLGIAELSALQVDDGRRHLEQALALARRIGRPYLEMNCLAYLALAAAHGGQPMSVARRSAEQAVAIAEAHAWDSHPDAAAPLAVAGMTLVWLGRFPEAERLLERAQRALAGGRAAAIEVLLADARALLLLGQRRFEDALAAVRASEEPQRALAAEHPLRIKLHARALRAQLELGERAAVRAALEGMPLQTRSRNEIRLAAAALELADGHPERALEELAPVMERSAPAVYPGPAAIEALLLAAVAHEQLGDARAVRDALEDALALAEPDGIVLPFALVAPRELLKRHRDHRTAHATLLGTILDLLAGASVGPEIAPLLEPLSDAELRVVRHLPSNLTAPEIAAELCVSANTVRTHMRHIYAKLDVHTRNDAVTRGRQLGLLAPSGLAG